MITDVAPHINKPSSGAQAKFGHGILEGCLGYWLWTEADGLQVNSILGWNHGVVRRDTSSDELWTSGIWGTAFDSKATAGRYVEVPLLWSPQKLTAVVFFRRTDTSYSVKADRMMGQPESQGWGMWMDPGGQHVWITRIGTSGVYGNSTWTDTEPHMSAFSYDGSFCRFYRDGRPDGAPAYGASFNRNSGVGHLNRHSPEATGDLPLRAEYYISGFWNRALSELEIRELWADPMCVVEGGLDYWDYLTAGTTIAPLAHYYRHLRSIS